MNGDPHTSISSLSALKLNVFKKWENTVVTIANGRYTTLTTMHPIWAIHLFIAVTIFVLNYKKVGFHVDVDVPGGIIVWLILLFILN